MYLPAKINIPDFRALWLLVVLVFSFTPPINSDTILTPRDGYIVETKQCTFSGSRLICDLKLTSFRKARSEVGLSDAKLVMSENSNSVDGLLSFHKKNATNLLVLNLGEYEVQFFSIQFPLKEFALDQFWLSLSIKFDSERRKYYEYSLPIRKIRNDKP